MEFFNVAPGANTNKKSIEFPVSYDIKIIMHGIKSDKENSAMLIEVFNNLDIKHGKITSKPSKTGKYVSYTVKVTIENKHIFNSLYKQLTEMPAVKMAI